MNKLDLTKEQIDELIWQMKYVVCENQHKQIVDMKQKYLKGKGQMSEKERELSEKYITAEKLVLREYRTILYKLEEGYKYAE